MDGFEELNTAPVETLGPWITMCIATGFGLIVACLHLLAHWQKPTYRLWRTLMLISPLIAMATMAVGTNLAAAFTLFGTLAIVRFRTPIKDPLDAAFVIFSVVIGLAMGNQNLHVAIVGTVVITGAIIALLIISRISPRENRASLRLVVEGAETDDKEWANLLRSKNIRYSIDSYTIDQSKNTQTFKLQIGGVDQNTWPTLLKAIMLLPNVKEVNGRTDDE